MPQAEAKKVKETIESNGADASAPQGQGDIVVTIEHCKSWQVGFFEIPVKG